MSKSLCFVDTNIFVYAYDRQSGSKYEAAGALLTDLWHKRTGVLSMQVLQELTHVLMRKVAKPVSPGVLREIVEDLLTWRVAKSESTLMLTALSIAEKYGISIWDSLMVASASQEGCELIYSEDLNHGQKYSGVRVVNPFR